MHEQGLSENYYVLAEQGEKYYCCCVENERIYMYSSGIGITQTKYGMLYDYIMEQMELFWYECYQEWMKYEKRCWNSRLYYKYVFHYLFRLYSDIF